MLFALDVISRIAHVGTAIALIGGSLFIAAVLLPVLGGITAEQAEAMRTGIHQRWKRFVHTGIVIFLISGIYNYLRARPLHDGDALYHALLGIKMLLALGVFFIAAALVGRSSALARIRENRGRWLAILLALAGIIVCISGFVKIRGPKPSESQDQLEVAVASTAVHHCPEVRGEPGGSLACPNRS